MEKADTPKPEWPVSIANWLAFEKDEPCLFTEEFPLFTDARITGEIGEGPYLFINTVAFESSAPRPAIVLRYAQYKAKEDPDLTYTNTELYHGGSPPQELAAFASLAMGIRLRAGYSTRRFDPLGDPFGKPTELRSRGVPFFAPPDRYTLPSAVGAHSLDALQILQNLPKLTQADAGAVVRAARLYQDALWLAESEPELTWLLLVSALETAANAWQKKDGNHVSRLRHSKPDLYKYLTGLNVADILSTVAEHIADSLGSTRKFVNFILKFLPQPPEFRPPEFARFDWKPSQLKEALGTIYGYRSKALHDGRPFPPPMCEAPMRLDSSWEAPSEKMLAQAMSQRGGVWLAKHIPMNLHLFEYIARNVLLNWWQSCAPKDQTSRT